MIEYPSIIGVSKAPREECWAFNKIDGSNIRAKYTQKKGFESFGSRYCLIDESHPHLGKAVAIFKEVYAEPLGRLFRDKYRDYREIITFFEFFGKNSFAGIHDPNDQHRIYVFDVLLGHKDRKFVSPKEFVKTFSDKVLTPDVIYQGKLNEDFIQRVRGDEFGLQEGVICKGLTTNGAYRGKIWMCKIKTNKYLQSLRDKGLDLTKYGE